MAKNRSVYERNQCGIRVKKCCASCAMRDFTQEGNRICALSKKEVEGSDRCRLWQMSDGLKYAGKIRGVVRDIYTKEVILH